MAAFDVVDGSSTGARSAIEMGAVRALMIRRSQMQTITTIGLDIAKSVFKVHCVDANGSVVLRRQLKRRYVLAFSRSCRLVSSGSRRAPRLTIGRDNPLVDPFRGRGGCPVPLSPGVRSRLRSPGASALQRAARGPPGA
jgi:hypothetical protein